MAPEELDLARESADVNIMVSGGNPGNTPPTPSLPAHPRRRSIYNFFLRHQDAVETPDDSSPLPFKKIIQSNGASHPLPSTPAEETKPKRVGSVIKRKPLDRFGSCKVKSSTTMVPDTKTTPDADPENETDVSILVTEPSPDSPSSRPSLHRQQSEPTVVQVLVHRESEEYHQESSEENLELDLEQCIVDIPTDDDQDS